MLILDTTSALVRLVTSSTADLEINASYVDFTEPDTFASDGQNTIITTATTTTVVASPGASIKRNIKGLNIKNEHATTANTVTVEHTDGTTVVTLFKVILAAGEALILNDAGVWFVYDVNGGVKMGATAATDTVAGLVKIATQAELETPASAVYAVTPARMHFHPGMAKFVCMTTGTTTPVMVTPPSYNMTSITDAGVGRLTVTIATDFSSANWACQATVIGVSTTLTAVALANTTYIRTATIAAGTIEVNCRDATATTNALADPSGYMVCGWGDHA